MKFTPKKPAELDADQKRALDIIRQLSPGYRYAVYVGLAMIVDQTEPGVIQTGIQQCANSLLQAVHISEGR